MHISEIFQAQIKEMESLNGIQNPQRSKYGFYFNEEMIQDYYEMKGRNSIPGPLDYLVLLEDKNIIREFRNPVDLFLVQFTYRKCSHQSTQRYTTTNLIGFVNFIDNSPIYNSWTFLNVFWRCWYHPRAYSYEALRELRSISIDHELHSRQIASFTNKARPAEEKPTCQDVNKFINQINLIPDNFENKIQLDIIRSYLKIYYETELQLKSLP